MLTCSLFYPMRMLGTSLPMRMLGTSLPMWVQAGMVAVEMELSVLLVLASLRGVAAGGVFAIDGNPVALADMADYRPHRDVVRTATDAAVRAGLDSLTACEARINLLVPGPSPLPRFRADHRDDPRLRGCR